MADLEIVAIGITWALTCVLSFVVGYLTAKAEEET